MRTRWMVAGMMVAASGGFGVGIWTAAPPSTAADVAGSFSTRAVAVQQWAVPRFDVPTASAVSTPAVVAPHVVAPRPATPTSVPRPVAAPAPVVHPAVAHPAVVHSAVVHSAVNVSTTPGYGCGPALAYLAAHAAPGFVFHCPGYSQGHQAMTCINVTGVCPGQRLIAINDPCPAAYQNEASNSWVMLGLRSAPIDPFGYCHH